MSPPRLAALGLAAALGGCASEGDEAERAVRAYNQAAILAYRTRDFGPLREVATEKEWGRVVVLVDLKTASGLVLEPELQSLTVMSASRPGPDALRAVTRERWRYWDRPLQPGRQPGPTLVAEMTLEYDLVREQGKWKLASARTLSNEYLEPRGWKPEVGHGHGERAGGSVSGGGGRQDGAAPRPGDAGAEPGDRSIRPPATAPQSK